MNWPQIRQGRMLLKGTQFPLLQPLAEPVPSNHLKKAHQDMGLIQIIIDKYLCHR
jgi:hypothetical protein